MSRRYFSESSLSRLETMMQTKVAEAKSYLLWEGDAADKLYFVRSGRVKLFKTSEEGKELVFSMAQDGDLFGELSDVPGALSGYSAEAMTDCELGVIAQCELEQAMLEDSVLALEMMKWMNLEQRIAQSKFRDLVMFGNSGALASTLIRLCNGYGVAEADGIQLTIKLTNTELANFIGTTRESVNRLLNSFKADGAVSFDRGQLKVHRLDYFRKIAGCPTAAVCPREVCRL